jgi:hypothetical protein
MAPSKGSVRAGRRVRNDELRALEERYRNELMAEEERLELREQIVRLKKKAGAR